MATYPIKMLRDENQEPFVPMVSADSIYTSDGKSFEENFASKLEASDLKEGTGIILEQDGNSTTISVDFGATDNIIDNLNTTVAGQGPLDARQGNVLKNMIPTIVDNLDSTDATKVLSANQGHELKEMSVPTGGATGQVLKKASDNDHELEWGDAADPNAIVGDGTIMSIVELSYADYKALEAAGELKADTEYHITDVENGTASYITEEQIQNIVVSETSPMANQIQLNTNNIDKMKTKILWQNPDTLAGYEAQSITVKDDSAYEFIMLIFDGYVPYHNFCSYIFKKPDFTYQLPFGQLLWNGSSGVLEFRERYITRHNSTTYEFSSGKVNGQSNNAIAVPVRILGFNLIQE